MLLGQEMLLDRNLLEVRIVELNQQGYDDVLPASFEISVELCQEVPLLVVELDNQLGPHVADHLQHVRHLV